MLAWSVTMPSIRVAELPGRIPTASSFAASRCDTSSRNRPPPTVPDHRAPACSGRTAGVSRCRTSASVG